MNAAAKYRKLPVVIEAIQVPLTLANATASEFKEFCDALRDFGLDRNDISRPVVIHSDYLTIRTLAGTMRTNPGDWIIRGVEGELYPCTPGIFAATYEPAGPADDPPNGEGSMYDVRFFTLPLWGVLCAIGAVGVVLGLLLHFWLRA